MNSSRRVSGDDVRPPKVSGCGCWASCGCSCAQQASRVVSKRDDVHAERGGAYRALVNLEVREQLASVRILGQHADDRLLDDALGDARLHTANAEEGEALR